MEEQKRYGAYPADWDFLTLIAGRTEDLLPTVSNKALKISPLSSMPGVGKTPSLIRDGLVSGFSKWAQYEATQHDIDRWSKNPNYGISINTREWRAIDIDLEDYDKVAEILSWRNFRYN